jgi:hypothetical protein
MLKIVSIRVKYIDHRKKKEWLLAILCRKEAMWNLSRTSEVVEELLTIIFRSDVLKLLRLLVRNIGGDWFAILKAAGLIPFQDCITRTIPMRCGRRSGRLSAANPRLRSGRGIYLKAPTAKHPEIKAWRSNSFEPSDKSKLTQERRSNERNS